MAKLAVARPGAKLYLGDQSRMHSDNFCLSGIGHRRLLLLPTQLVQHLSDPDGLSFLKPVPTLPTSTIVPSRYAPSKREPKPVGDALDGS